MAARRRSKSEHRRYSYIVITMEVPFKKKGNTGLVILHNGATLHSPPQIASDRTIPEKSRNSQKNANYSQNKP